MAAKKESKTLQDQLNILFGPELFEETEKKLIFGSVFMIPDDISGIPSLKRKKGKSYNHPFVVIKYYKETNKIVLCALRTSDLSRRGFFTPANVLPGLDKDGVIIIDEQFRIDAQRFVGLMHIGYLPESYVSELKNWIRERKAF
jgi:hypothetical protein